MGAGDIIDLKFSPDGRWLAAARGENGVVLWDLHKNEKVEFPLSNEPAMSLAFSPDGELLAIGGWDTPKVYLWDLKKQAAVETPSEISTRSNVDIVAFNRSSQLLLFGENSRLALWSFEQHKLIEITDDYWEYDLNTDFSPNGKGLAAVAMLQQLMFWDIGHLADGKAPEKRVIDTDFAGEIGCLAYLPDGISLALCVGNKIIFWDIASQKEIEPSLSAKTRLVHIALSPDGRRLASVDEKHHILLWDLATRKSIAEMKGDPESRYRLAISPDSRWLAYGNEKGVTLWDMASDLSAITPPPPQTLRDRLAEINLTEADLPQGYTLNFDPVPDFLQQGIGHGEDEVNYWQFFKKGEGYIQVYLLLESWDPITLKVIDAKLKTRDGLASLLFDHVLKNIYGMTPPASYTEAGLILPLKNAAGLEKLGDAANGLTLKESVPGSYQDVVMVRIDQVIVAVTFLRSPDITSKADPMTIARLLVDRVTQVLSVQ
jgi:hypothetical protein